MKKIKIIIIYIILFTCVNIYSAVLEYECGKGGESVEITGICSYGNFTDYRYVGGYYTDSASAYTEALARKAQLEAEFPGHTASVAMAGSVGVFSADTDIWQAWKVLISDCTASEQFTKAYYLFFPQTGWVDEDEDCLQDGGIPCEDECYIVWKGMKDSSGDWLYVKVVTTEGRVLTFGNAQDAMDCLNGTSSDCEEYTNYLASVELENADPETCDNTCDIETDLSITEASTGDGIQTQDIPEPEKGTSGQESDPSDTDSDLLGKIADNTSETANNTDGLEEGLTDIEIQLILANQKLEEISNKSANSSNLGTPDSYDKQRGQALVDATETIDPDDFEFDETDVSTPSTITSILNTISADNPVDDYLDNISFTISNPSCNIETSFDLYETTIPIEISLCEYEDELETTGDLLYAVAILVFILIIFL